ncbi:MAG: DUF2851 family protein [Saprospiraceae bacterium]|nr:DUF2851 family protein [Saprospiraceae bacterium]
MKEDLLHYFWRTKKWGNYKLKTTTGEPIEIIYQGDFNTDQGPDFNFAKIKIGSTLWNGKVEMHIDSSDWIVHEHIHDPQYKNVVLHVVWNHDAEIIVQGIPLPTLELKAYISEDELKHYSDLILNAEIIPCAKQIKKVPTSIIISELEENSIQRIQSKIQKLESELFESQQNWNFLLFKYFARYLMGPVNAIAMDNLISRITFPQLMRSSDSLENLEAILLGTAGLLDDSDNTVLMSKLNQYYSHFQRKFNIQTMEKENWYFARIRPASFPTLRLAQLASCLFSNKLQLDIIIQMNYVSEVYKHFSNSVSEYWQTHYRFSQSKNKPINGRIGRDTLNVIIINALVPLLYLYGKLNFQDSICQKSIQWLEEISPEKNKITKIYTQLGVMVDNSRLSQGCLEQYYKKCTLKKCTECKIGHTLLKGSYS